MNQLKMNTKIIIESESDYWSFVNNLSGKNVNTIQKRAKYTLQNFIVARERIKSNPNYGK